ncbi:MAG: hypothetical protein J0H29_01445 [Sphingobacteriales bacterium]|nr:hypothetical protein [Sphingobacteriales bacterium]
MRDKKKLRRLLCLLVGMAFVSCLKAQPVGWSVTAQKKAGDMFTITAVPSLEKGWHIYAEKDEVTGIDGVQVQYESDAVSAAGALITDRTTVTIKDSVFDNRAVKVYTGDVRFSQDIRVTGTGLHRLRITVSGFAASGNEFQPFEQTLSVPLTEETAGVSSQETLTLKNINLASPIGECGGAADSSSKGIAAIFLLGFAGGLIALLTPCVFPMIPLTVSFFSSQAGIRQSRS